MKRELHILGIEGTAWNLSAAVVNNEKVVAEASATYVPASGGIHPREAAQHHASSIGEIIKKVFESADAEKIDAVAFSQGPGMGPCLRTAATAARTLSLSLGVPLIGVNHCVAHIEVGRWMCNVKDPVVVYVSGGNSQIIAYRDKHYRVFGETLDISIGNALDKIARALNLPHPGGPKIEALAKKSKAYIKLPYVVKGMDLSFSGLATAAQEACRRGMNPNDVCYSFQETAFAMLVEVTERALAHTRKSEVILVGGVGANERLREMLDSMCRDRGAGFHVPDKKFLGDNGMMIAYTGLVMFRHGVTLSVDKSAVKPNFRTDEVDIVWMDDADESRWGRPRPATKKVNKTHGMTFRGAEAIVEVREDVVSKKRNPKAYRIREIDETLRGERTKNEAKIISDARKAGVPTPIIIDVMLPEYEIKMERIDGELLRSIADEKLCTHVGEIVGKLHRSGIIHGDLTTSNMILSHGRIYLIDFGLSYYGQDTEARGVDVHVLFQTFKSTHDRAEKLREAFALGYRKTFSGADEVLRRVEEIERRGRYIR